MNWWVLAIGFIMSARGDIADLQPVRLKLLPAEPMRAVRSLPARS